MNNRRGLGTALAGDHAVSCAKVLDVPLPTTTSALKTAYRELARIHHPDKGGDAATFRRIKDAYDYLAANGVDVGVMATADHKLQAERTVQGDFISDLGKGLGHRVNAKPCETCDGRGYSSSPNPYSGGSLLIRHTCYKCGGAGEVLVWNPVLPKMRMVSGQTKQGSKPRVKEKRHSGRFL